MLFATINCKQHFCIFAAFYLFVAEIFQCLALEKVHYATKDLNISNYRACPEIGLFVPTCNHKTTWSIAC